jgi:hypothetical protein
MGTSVYNELRFIFDIVVNVFSPIFVFILILIFSTICLNFMLYSIMQHTCNTCTIQISFITYDNRIQTI